MRLRGKSATLTVTSGDKGLVKALAAGEEVTVTLKAKIERVSPGAAPKDGVRFQLAVEAIDAEAAKQKVAA